MNEYTFEDALARGTVSCAYPGMVATCQPNDKPLEPCEALFFPGCSLINYGMPLVQSVYNILTDAGQVGGISLLCCGKILEYEPDEGALRRRHEQDLRDRMAAVGVKKIIAACPNCVFSLRRLLAEDERTRAIEVVPLPKVLVELGYRVGTSGAAEAAAKDARMTASPVFSVHDSCPDRETGEFADALRTIMPQSMLVEPAHTRAHSFCCGSRPRAVGRADVAQRMVDQHVAEARAAGANAIVTACVSCTLLLSKLQQELPVYHYLELLFNWRVPWDDVDQYMKTRFLFDDVEGARSFVGLDGEGAADDAAAQGEASC
jgi:Fe-S oxidoreductase